MLIFAFPRAPKIVPKSSPNPHSFCKPSRNAQKSRFCAIYGSLGLAFGAQHGSKLRPGAEPKNLTGPSFGFLEKPFGRHPLRGPLGPLFATFWLRFASVFALGGCSGTSPDTPCAHLDAPVRVLHSFLFCDYYCYCFSKPPPALLVARRHWP